MHEKSGWRDQQQGEISGPYPGDGDPGERDLPDQPFPCHGSCSAGGILKSLLRAFYKKTGAVQDNGTLARPALFL